MPPLLTQDIEGRGRFRPRRSMGDAISIRGKGGSGPASAAQTRRRTARQVPRARRLRRRWLAVGPYSPWLNWGPRRSYPSGEKYPGRGNQKFRAFAQQPALAASFIANPNFLFGERRGRAPSRARPAVGREAFACPETSRPCPQKCGGVSVRGIDPSVQPRGGLIQRFFFRCMILGANHPGPKSLILL